MNRDVGFIPFKGKTKSPYENSFRVRLTFVMDSPRTSLMGLDTGFDFCMSGG